MRYTWIDKYLATFGCEVRVERTSVHRAVRWWSSVPANGEATFGADGFEVEEKSVVWKISVPSGHERVTYSGETLANALADLNAYLGCKLATI